MSDRQTSKPRWYHFTPDRFLLGLLFALGFLLLSEWFCWFPFNEHKGWTVLIAVATLAAALVFMLLWFVVAMIFRRRFQFSLRSLMLLVVVVSVLCSWFSVKMRAANRQEKAFATLRKYDGIIRYDVDYPDTTVEPPTPPWLMDMLGRDFFCNLNHVCLAANETFTDETAACFEELPHLNFLRLGRAALSDDGLKHLRNLRKLTSLRLIDMQITDAGLEHLEGLTSLDTVTFYSTQVTDKGVKKLQKALPNCEIYLC